MLKTKFLLLLLLMLVGAFSVSGQVIDADQTAETSSFVIPLDEDDDTNSTDDDETDSTDEKDEDDEEDEKDSDDDGVDDDKEEAYEREIEVESEKDRFRSESELKNGNSKDEFEVEFDVQSDNAAELKFEYSTEVEEGDFSNETELSYEVKFDEIIEFNDTGAPGYQNETAVQVYEIGKSGWNDLVVNYNSTIGFVEVNATSADGVFTLSMKLSSTFLIDDNVTLSPNSLKIDVIINNFDYNGTDTKLAIKSQVKTESELSIEHESEDEEEGIAKNETQLSIGAANATGFFSWVEYAMMDGQIVDIISSSFEDSTEEEGETSSKMYFTFNSTSQAEKIVWDPKMGVSSQAAKANLPADTTSDNSDTTKEDTTNESSDGGTSEEIENTEGLSLPFAFAWSLLLFVAVPVIRITRRNT